MNVKLEPIIRGLKSDIFEVLNPFHLYRIQLQKKKGGVKKCLEIMTIQGDPTPNGKKHLKFPF